MNTADHEHVKAYIARRIALYGRTAYASRSEHARPTDPAEAPAAAPLAPPQRSNDALLFPAPAAPLTLDRGYTHMNEPWTTVQDIQQLNDAICACMKCPLGKTRTKFVFGVGDPHAGLMIVGEAPGKDEDEQGEPFVGRAGQLLNKILEAINFKREEVFICNILKCRPPGNRDPLPEEVAQCEPYLMKQIDLIKPRIILALGRIAANTLLQSNSTMAALRATEHNFHGVPLMATYHPAALLRNPDWKRAAWEDVKKLRARYDALMG